MRKIYLLLFLLISNAGMAQIHRWADMSQPKLNPSVGDVSETVKVKGSGENLNRTSGTAAVIFTEDFSNGFSGQGANGSWATYGSQTAAVWEYRGPNTTPDVTVGSRGAYVGTRGPIQSPTASNGFMIFDSDYLDNGGVVGGQGLGVAPGPHDGYLVSPSINLSGYGAGDLEFSYNQYLRQHYAVHNVQASTDNGLTWTTVFTFPNLTPGPATATTDVVRFVVPASVAGNANVKFRFEFDGTTLGSFGYYFWMVDDVKIEESLPNNLVIKNLPRPRIFFDQNTLWGQYHQVPSAFSTPINFDMTVLNFGYEIQHGTHVTADIQDMATGATVQSAQSSPVVLPVNNDVLMDVITPAALQPGSHTNYKAMFTASSDSTENSPEDNVDSIYFAITDTVFARDNGQVNGSLSNGSFVSYDGALTHTYFQRYDVRGAPAQGFKVNSLSVRVSPSTDTVNGIYLVPMLLDTNYDPAAPITDVNNFAYWQFVDHLPPNNTDSATGPIGRWFTMPVRMTNGAKHTVYSADDEVGAAIQINGGTQTNRVYIIIDNTTQPAQTSLLDVDGSLLNIGTRNLAIRMNIEAIMTSNRSDKEAGKAGLRLLQNAPNPFNDLTRIRYEMDVPMSEVMIEVYDMAGKIVFSRFIGKQNAGEHSVDFHAAGLNSGVYFYKLITDKAVLTQRMILK